MLDHVGGQIMPRAADQRARVGTVVGRFVQGALGDQDQIALAHVVDPIVDEIFTTARFHEIQLKGVVIVLAAAHAFESAHDFSGRIPAGL